MTYTHPLSILIHHDMYNNWVFNTNHPTQGRRFINAKNLLIEKVPDLEIERSDVAPIWELERVHGIEYINNVMRKHQSGEWVGSNPILSQLASMFVGGTIQALNQLLYGLKLTAVHFPGAKHHAQKDRSSGFCVFADFAIAADIATKDYGKRVAIFDIDAHHGDGTEILTFKNENVLTYSIHEYGIFPGTGYQSFPDYNVFNYPVNSPLPGQEKGVDNSALYNGTFEFINLATEFNPDLIFIACGADGHESDPLSNLRYTKEGYSNVAKILRNKFPSTPMLIGGAGGYQPDTHTPDIWSEFAMHIIKGAVHGKNCKCWAMKYGN